MQSSRSRVGGSHKNVAQRGVLAVRASVQVVLDAFGEEDVDVPKARVQLEHVEKALRSLEISLSKVSLCGCHRSGILGRPEQDSVLRQIEHENPDTAKWLTETFTQHHIDVADSDLDLQVSRTKSRRARRSGGIWEQNEDVHQALSLPSVAAIMEQCGGYGFNALDLAAALEDTKEQPIALFGAHVLQYRGDMMNCIQQRGWIQDSGIFSQTFMAFLSQLDDLYRPDVRYHNAAHAVDTMATMDVLMRSTYVLDRSSSLDHVLALAAAAVHDVGHPGKNSMFQMKTMSSLAIRYNDQSILENMHVSLAFQTMQQDPECNWLTLLAKDSGTHQVPNLQQYARQSIISMVLATDMAKHQKYVAKLAGMLDCAGPASESRASKGPAEKQEALEEKFFILETLLHAADLSNPCKSRKIALSWTQRVCEEFWLQGDEERRLGLAISPMCDRVAGAAAVPQGQLGFINFVVRPLVAPLAELVVEVQPLKEQLDENAAFWEEKAAECTSFEQLFGDGPQM